MQTLLVVDDNDYHRTWLKLELTDAGYRVLTAGNGREALNLVQTVHPDLVLQDLMRPGMKGLDVLQQLHDVDPHLPVIIHTVYSVHDHHPVTDLASAYLVKSSDTGLLKRTIAAVLYGRCSSRMPSTSSVRL